MKTILTGLLFCFAAFPGSDVSGKWSGYPLYVIFKQDGGKLTGSAGMSVGDQMPFEKATIVEDRITFRIGSIEAELRVNGDEMSGEAHQGAQTMKVLLHRVKVRDPNAPPLRFEVVSLHSVPPAAMGKGSSSSTKADPGRITWKNVTLQRFITTAWNVREFEVAGPDWLKDQGYDMTAGLPPGTSIDDVQVMLQTLLAERFGLKIHRETRELPIYALVTAKGGLKLQPAVNPGHTNISGDPKGRTLTAEATLTSLATSISNFTDRPVIDMTNTPGAFKIVLEWTPEDTAPPASAGDSAVSPSLFTALAEVGLKLEPRKAPVEMIVVDHAEKTPTEN